MNENKEIFAYRDANGECDLRRKIEPRFTHRNMERSGFITHGAALSMIQGSGVTRETIARVAEDRDNWASYVDHGSQLTGQRTAAAEAKGFFGMTPEDRFAKLKC